MTPLSFPLGGQPLLIQPKHSNSDGQRNIQMKIHILFIRILTTTMLRKRKEKKKKKKKKHNKVVEV